LSHPYSSRNYPPSALQFRINHKIRAREIRVIGVDGKQEGIMSLNDALTKARANDVDLVEIAPNATPPVCRLVDYGKFRYEQSKKDKDSRRHQHANKVKEIQLSPTIDPHDFKVKLTHATNFLCDEMKVKLTLRFRGREMAHQDIGFQTVNSFIKDLAPYGHPDSPPKLIGRGINVMMSPLPRAKRAKNPHEIEEEAAAKGKKPATGAPGAPSEASGSVEVNEAGEIATLDEKSTASEFANNPFAKLDVNTTP
jgi:translation initiation factor IF-3